MRKRSWVELGIVTLGLLLICGAVEFAAQTPGMEALEGTGTEAAPRQEQPVAAGPTTAPQAPGPDSEQWQAIARLRAEVEQLQQELARLRAQVAAGTGPAAGGAGMEGTEGAGGPGTGGAGTAGIGEPMAEGPGVGGTGAGGEQPGTGGGGATRVGSLPGDTSQQGTVVADIIYTGQVRSVSSRELVLIDEAGAANPLPLARNVRVLRGRSEVTLDRLQQGMRVRVTANLLAHDNPVVQIEILPQARRRS